jgi:transcriptional regulator with XRE-family HTH domain
MTEDEIEAIDAKVEEIRQALIERRKAEGLTTRELAARVGMSQSTITYIENRSDLSGIRPLMRLAAAYSVALPDLAGAFRASKAFRYHRRNFIR